MTVGGLVLGTGLKLELPLGSDEEGSSNYKIHRRFKSGSATIRFVVWEHNSRMKRLGIGRVAKSNFNARNIVLDPADILI